MIRSRRTLALLLLPLLAACQAPAVPVPSTPTPLSGALTPYRTAAVTPSPLPSPTPAAPLPSPTPTPRIHRVEEGEDMFGIALRYGVSLDALMAANPDVDPGLLKGGMTLVIPTTAEGEPAQGLPSPTPAAAALGALDCSPTREGGAWCFVRVTNTQSTPLDNLSAVIRMADGQGALSGSQTAFAPLDLLAPGATLPLAAYFPPPVPQPFVVSAELRTALPVSESGRYLAVQVQAQPAEIAPGGLLARVEGVIRLEQSEGEAGAVWVAAAAYGSDGQVVGVRRWESPRGLAAGQALPFDFQVYSAGEPIVRVEVQAEARP